MTALQLSPKYVSVLLLLTRIWDGFSDPIVGYLISRTHSRHGRLRIWYVPMHDHNRTCQAANRCFVSIWVCLAAYFMFWLVPDAGTPIVDVSLQLTRVMQGRGLCSSTSCPCCSSTSPVMRCVHVVLRGVT